MALMDGADVSPGLYYFAGKTPQIGAYLPDYSGDLTVYWRGKVDRAVFRKILIDTEQTLTRSVGSVVGTLDAYGNDKDRPELHVGPTPNLMDGYGTYHLSNFDACRAVLTSHEPWRIVVWANVSGRETPPLQEGGETISFSGPQKLAIDGPLRKVIIHAICKTMPIDEATTASLFESVSDAVQNKKLGRGFF
jgi:hypothetical protein